MHKLIAGGAVWLCGIQFFIVQVIAQSRWTTPYSLSANYISDLGNTVCANYPPGSAAYVCSPLHALLNLSFSGQGVTIVGGLAFVGGRLGRSLIGKILIALLVLTAVGMVGVGLFPENTDNQAHVTAAGLQFVTSNLAVMAASSRGVVPGTGRIYSLASLIFGCVGLAATCLFPIGVHLGLGIGGMERVAAYTFPVWLAVTGLLLVKLGRREIKHLQS